MSTGSLSSSPSWLPAAHAVFECGEVSWHVRRFEIEETLGRPYTATLQLITADTDLMIEELVGVDALLEIRREDRTRLLRGIVDEVEHLGATSHHARVRLRMVPLVSWLARTKTSRIFQDKTIAEILGDVLGPALSARGRAFDVSALNQREPAPRDYCVQFHESDLNFVHRLLEEEGLTYFFDHAPEDGERMVFMDCSEGFAAFEEDAAIPLVRGEEVPDTETVTSFSWRRRARAPQVYQRDWDWMPSPPQIYEATSQGTRPDDAAPDARPVLAVHESGGHRLQSPAVEEIARRKHQVLAALEAAGTGQSNSVRFTPGMVFELVDEELAGRYLLTQVTHEGDAPEVDLLAGDKHRVSAAPSYGNRFHCLPADKPYGPPHVAARPVIAGPQTAVVTGPEGEEIHTDEHGRIKVRMHWDRAGRPPGDDSRWIRVAQMWGGLGWGSLFLPRIGMEVIVTFIQGDPDRPLVTGCVYNGGHRPPYALPGEKTKSGVRSSSSPGGEGFNELTFEDAAGREEIFLHAQRDHTTVVKRDDARRVGGSQSLNVGGSRTVTVTGNQSVTIQGRQGEDALDRPHYALDVRGDAKLAATKTVHVTAADKITLQCKTTIVELTEESIVLQAGNEGSRIELDVETLIRSKAAGTVHLDTAGNIRATANDRASLSLTDAAVLESQPGARVTLLGDAKIGAPRAEQGRGAHLQLDGDASLVGQKVALGSQGAGLTLTTAAELVAEERAVIQGTSASFLGQSVTVQGSTVDVLGDALVTVRAPVAKIN